MSDDMDRNVFEQLDSEFAKDPADGITVRTEDWRAVVLHLRSEAEQDCRKRIKADRLYCMSHGGEVAQQVAAENAELRQRVQDCESAILRRELMISQVEAALEQTKDRVAELEKVRELAEKIRDIAIESPSSNNMLLIYRLACQQAERAGGEK